MGIRFRVVRERVEVFGWVELSFFSNFCGEVFILVF